MHQTCPNAQDDGIKSNSLSRIMQKNSTTYPIKMLAQKLNKPIIPRITKHFALNLCTVPGWSRRTARLTRPSPVQSHMAWAYHAP